MKASFAKSLVSLTLLVNSASAFADSNKSCDEQCQIQQVNGYFSALDKVARSGSTTNDIDSLLSLMDDTVKYQHLQYGADFTKETWRKAFIRNLTLGRYNNTRQNEIRITNSINGKDHIAIEYSHGILKSDGSWQAKDKYLALFAFKEGKISLVQELW